MSTKSVYSTSTMQQQGQNFDSQPPAYNNSPQQFYEPPHSYPSPNPSPNPSAPVIQEQYQTYQSQQYTTQQQNQDQPQYPQQQQFQQPTDYPEGLSTYRRPPQKESKYHYDSNQGIIGNIINVGVTSLSSLSSSSGAIDSFLTGRAQRKANKPKGLIGSLKQMGGDYLMKTPVSQQEQYVQQKQRMQQQQMQQQQQQQYGDYRS